MGAAVAAFCDVAVVTADNPRHEAPEVIVADILPGLKGLEPWPDGSGPGDLSVGSGRVYRIEHDRRAAIEWAIEVARPGDVVLVAGKGHEDYQIIGDDKRHFDDREETARALARRGWT
jgi:UDP-N-acetylmuramoyl-L-alanyl-D-glutamate--2,6-diaminopimelate ligase